MKSVALLITLLLSSVSQAGTATLNWVAPTQNTDGSSLTNLASYKVYSATSSAACGTGTATTVVAPASTYTVQNLTVGTWYFCLKAVNSNGTESALSAIASKAIPDVTPNPPTGLTVTATTAYYIIQQDNKLVALPIGTIAAGESCNPDYGAIVAGVTYYGVDSKKVTWYGKTKSLATFAACGA